MPETPAVASKLEQWPVTRLAPYERNARTHSPQQVTQIAASIEEFGFNNPILVDGEAGIIAGHGRLMAAKQLGLKEVPVVVLEHLSEAQKRAYVLADNKLALNAGWDEEVLKLEMSDLLNESINLEILGWNAEELSELWGGEFSGVEEEPEPEDDPIDRGVAIPIVLSPEELLQWRKAKAELGYSTDKTAFMKLVVDLLEEVQS